MGRRHRRGQPGTAKFTETDILREFCCAKPKRKTFGAFKIDGETLELHASRSEDVRGCYDKKEFAKWRKDVGRRIAELDGKLLRDGRVALLEAFTPDDSTGNLKIQCTVSETVARCLNTPHGPLFVGNAERLTLASGDTGIQRLMRQWGFTMLPRETLDADLSTLEIVDRRLPIRVGYAWQRGYNDTANAVAHVSALLLKLDGQHYLYDADAWDAGHNFLNYFLTPLPGPCQTIEAAYASLKPQAVLDAENAGLEADVKRCGRCFFIPSPAPDLPELTIEERMTILVGNNAYGLSDTAKEYVCAGYIDPDEAKERTKALLERVPFERVLPASQGETRGLKAACAVTWGGQLYVKGEVTGTNRAPLNLDCWHVAVLRVGALPKHAVGESGDDE